jgi:putative transposase
MARKLRLEFPGAIYHVINRGNYRAWVFSNARTKAAFEACLLDACVRNGWILHAFVIMSNHYHLAVETPQGNLVTGMHWLQATFANRFNRLRGEHGHLFQGRYKALLVEEGDALGQVCHYLHLNPVRAGVLPVGCLNVYRYSSYWYLAHPNRRPRSLRVEAALSAAGDLPDTVMGRKCYRDYLAWQAAEGPAGKNAAYVSLTRGWAIGSKEFKSALVKDHALAENARAWESAGAQEMRAMRWQEALAKAMVRLPAQARKTMHKSAPWKVALATYLKTSTDVSNGWLAAKLAMGSSRYVSKHVSRLRHHPSGKAARWLAVLK